VGKDGPSPIDRQALDGFGETDIFDAVAASGPRTVGDWGVSFEEPPTSHPPRVVMTIPDPGEASPAAELWAREAVDRFGSDRVVIERGPGSTENECP
jgi:hypothetical protein